MSERGKPAGNSIHIGKGFPRLLAGKNRTEFRQYYLGKIPERNDKNLSSEQEIFG